MIKNARELAVNVLLDIFENDAYANISLDRSLQATELSPVDRHFATALVYGVLSKKALLDWYLAPLLKKTPKPWQSALFEITLYQIMLMDKVPTSAAVDEAVKLAKRREGQSAGNFVNAVLRNFMRSERRNELPQDWETRYSMPKLLLDKMVRQFGGKQTGEILASLESPSKASLRVNSPQFSHEEVKTELENEGFVLENSQLSAFGLVAKQGNFAATEAFEAGKFTIQDETSQLVAPLFELKGDEQVLDACAAPGGKTTHLAQYLTTGRVTACDLYEHKLELIEENAERLHLTDKIKTVKADASNLTEAFPDEMFDAILVDAPCSGLGLMRRKPDIRYRKEATDFLDLQALQLKILASAAQRLKKSAIMVYSTCTIFDEENFDVVKAFLASHPDFKQVEIQHEDPRLMREGCLFVTPELYQTDGFFIAKFQKIN